MVPITANILQPLVDVFESVLKFFHDSIGASWGLSIILLTIVVRAALLPLAVKQFRSMQSLQRIAPHLKILQEKYKDDKQRLQQETMKFYQEHKVNPFASCLPLVAQLPVFLSLFYMLRKDLRHDICPAINPPVLLILYVGSQLVSSLLMMTATADQNQKIIMLVLPFLFVGFIFRFPAGLILYWITTNIWTIGQQQFLRRVIGSRQPEAPPLPEVGPAPKGAAAASGGGGGGGGLLARLSGVTHQASTDGTSAGNGAASDKESRVTKAPPPPPRSRKRKRSGRRR
jgi:YidC/Oxa1 family membrane protein insertase